MPASPSSLSAVLTGEIKRTNSWWLHTNHVHTRTQPTEQPGDGFRPSSDIGLDSYRTDRSLREVITFAG